MFVPCSHCYLKHCEQYTQECDDFCDYAKVCLENKALKEGVSMYSKKYCLEKIEELNEHNPIYDGVEGSVCYPAYFNVGERGWFLWIEDGWFKEFAHRIHTSTIKNVEYADNQILVETQNTKFTFTAINAD